MKQRDILLVLALSLVVMAMLAPEALAASDEGGGLPYEDWLKKIQSSVTGPVAFTLGLVGIVVAGGILSRP
jgi:type IV secretion system protein VirB2